MQIDEIQNQIIEEFEAFDDWMDRYNYLIDLSRDLAPINPAYKSEEYLIRGCQSRVWVNAEFDGRVITYMADSDAIITKGIISLLIRILSGQTPDSILETNLFFIDRIGLSQNLSPTRSNGLLAMIKQMKLYALAYKTKSQNNPQP